VFVLYWKVKYSWAGRKTLKDPINLSSVAKKDDRSSLIINCRWNQEECFHFHAIIYTYFIQGHRRLYRSGSYLLHVLYRALNIQYPSLPMKTSINKTV
jgi:hypothetical protein